MSDETTPQDSAAMSPASAGSVASNRRLAQRLRVLAGDSRKVYGVHAFDCAAAMDEAAEVIESLCLTDGSVASGWISVADRLPDSDRPVLVWNSGGDCAKPWAWWQICDYKDGEWREQDERDEYPGVTHWMPLPPEPPNWKPIFPPPSNDE